jgi:hypothetical protein
VALQRQLSVPNGVDAAVKAMEAPTVQAILNLMARQPEHQQLATGDRAVLSACETRDRPIGGFLIECRYIR